MVLFKNVQYFDTSEEKTSAIVFLEAFKETARQERNISREMWLSHPLLQLASVQLTNDDIYDSIALCEGWRVLDPDLAAPGCGPPASRATRPFVGQRKTTQQVDKNPSNTVFQFLNKLCLSNLIGGVLNPSLAWQIIRPGTFVPQSSITAVLLLVPRFLTWVRACQPAWAVRLFAWSAHRPGQSLIYLFFMYYCFF